MILTSFRSRNTITRRDFGGRHDAEGIRITGARRENRDFLKKWKVLRVESPGHGGKKIGDRNRAVSWGFASKSLSAWGWLAGLAGLGWPGGRLLILFWLRLSLSPRFRGAWLARPRSLWYTKSGDFEPCPVPQHWDTQRFRTSRSFDFEPCPEPKHRDTLRFRTSKSCDFEPFPEPKHRGTLRFRSSKSGDLELSPEPKHRGTLRFQRCENDDSRPIRHRKRSVPL